MSLIKTESETVNEVYQEIQEKAALTKQVIFLAGITDLSFVQKLFGAYTQGQTTIEEYREAMLELGNAILKYHDLIIAADQEGARMINESLKA